jgi:beta-glucanase (GH16 family)
VFGLEWQSDRLTWYVDGQPRKTFSDPSRIYPSPMYVLLNLAIGGFSGDPEAATFPAEMRADYVRIWQRP